MIIEVNVYTIVQCLIQLVIVEVNSNITETPQLREAALLTDCNAPIQSSNL